MATKVRFEQMIIAHPQKSIVELENFWEEFSVGGVEFLRRPHMLFRDAEDLIVILLQRLLRKQT